MSEISARATGVVSGETGRADRRHRHVEFCAEDGSRIVVTRYAGGTARVTVLADDGSRREFTEANAGSDRWLLGVVGFALVEGAQ